MKILKSILLAVAVIATFLSCQKELAFDNNGVSAGSLIKDASGNCLPVTVNGVFKVDSVLTNANFVDVQVSVSTPGTFEVRSDTVNGYSFRKVGSVVFGSNTIRLYASGKPITSGTNTFTIRYGATTCSFDVTVVGPGVVPAVFTLGGSPNACSNASFAGVYTVNNPLDPSNTLTVEVNVTTPGTFVIAAASTGGFAFGASGLFTSTGLQNVTLTGTGTPLTAGSVPVTVTNVASTCTFNITVQPAAPPAVFTLDGAPNGCTNFVLAGTYTVGSVTSAANTVTLNVNVTTVGSYSITTGAVNGVTFSKTGVFTIAGPQPVTLVAGGTPVAAGPFTFKPAVGASTCDFSVNFVAAPPPPVGDYFPLTANSWWSYDIIVGGVPEPDSVLHSSEALVTQNSNSYRRFIQSSGGVTVDSLYYRKSGNDYYKWGVSDGFSYQFFFDNPALVDIIFLKENAATNTTWSSATYTGTLGGGAANMDLKYDFKIVNANTSVTVNTVNYTNVIQVSITVQAKIAPSPAFIPFERNDFYYAKGIGFVKVVYNDLIGGSMVGEGNIRNYKVF